MNWKLTLLILLFFTGSINAQDSVEVEDTRRSEVLINAVLNYGIPQGDLSSKYKNFFGLGAGMMFKTKSDWYWGFEGQFLFSDNTKNGNSIISSISSNGIIIGENGRVANIFITQRGMSLQFLKLGRMLWNRPILNGNESSGVLGTVGFGVFQHQYRIIDRSGAAPQLSPIYSKGYDQLRNGFSLSPYLAYIYYDADKFINFSIGIEYTLAWTESRRDFDFALMKKDESKTLDQMLNLKLIWNIPIRKKLSRDFYYF
jgi:hypothetical protein